MLTPKDPPSKPKKGDTKAEKKYAAARRKQRKDQNDLKLIADAVLNK